MSNMIPCLDLKEQHQKIKEEIFQAFDRVYEKTAFSGGAFVEAFEESFASYCGSSYAVGLNSGTTALHLAMLALGIGPGDEVIIPSNTFIATAWGVSYTGATPVFVDCRSDTWEIDPDKIEEAITPKTKAVIGVHLYGQPFDIDAVQKICNAHDIYLVEDAAQAHGARYKGKTVGAFGEISCFSFYPGKNLGACGEGGGITTNNQSHCERIRSLRNHGCTERYYYDEIGYNYRMGGLEGASLSVKLKYIDGWNNRRQQIAKRYISEIRNARIQMQYQPEWAESVFHLFVVIADNKETFVSHLKKNGINPAFHYPVPCHLQKAYADLGYKNKDFPNAERLAESCVSLPMYAELTDQEVDKIINDLNKF